MLLLFFGFADEADSNQSRLSGKSHDLGDIFVMGETVGADMQLWLWLSGCFLGEALRQQIQCRRPANQPGQALGRGAMAIQ